MADVWMTEVVITLQTSTGESIHLRWVKETQQWTISGPVYPRYLKLMETIAEFARSDRLKA